MVDKFEYEPALIEGFIDAPGQPRVKELIAAARAFSAAFTELRNLRAWPLFPAGYATGAVLTPEQARCFAEQSVKALRTELAAQVAEGKVRAARSVLRQLLQDERDDLEKERADLQQQEPRRIDMVVGERSCSYSCAHTAFEHERNLSIRELNFLCGVEFLKLRDLARLVSTATATATDSRLAVSRQVVSALVREAAIP